MRINGKKLSIGLQTVLYALSTDVNRKALTHVHLVVRGEHLSVETTDGHRAEVVVLDVDEPKESFEALLTKEQAKNLAKEAKREDFVEVSIEGKTFKASCLKDPIEMPDERYPDITKVMPNIDNMCSLSCNVDALREVLGHVLALNWKEQEPTKYEKKSKDYSCRTPHFVLSPCPDGVKLEATMRDGTEVETILFCKHGLTEEFKVKVNPEYVRDMIKQVPKGSIITIHFGDAYSPILFCFEASTALLMPCRL